MNSILIQKDNSISIEKVLLRIGCYLGSFVAIFLVGVLIWGLLDYWVILDKQILDFFVNSRSLDLNTIFVWITSLADPQMVALATLGLSLILFVWQRGKYVFLLLFVVGGSFLDSILDKLIIQRPRPQGVGVLELSDYSLPSIHAALAMAVGLFLAFLCFQYIRSRLLRYAYYLFIVIFVLLIGLSRLYLGVHYFSDILLGYFIAAAWFAVSWYILFRTRLFGNFIYKMNYKALYLGLLEKVYLTGFIVLFFVVFYLYLGYSIITNLVY